MKITAFEGFVSELLELGGNLDNLGSIKLLVLVLGEVFVRVTSAIDGLLFDTRCLISSELPAV